MADIKHRRQARIKAVLTVAILALIGASMLTISWRRWPDILIDFGGELYSAWRLSSGEVLYRDVISLFGPLSFYVNSAVFRVFGAGFIHLALFNIALVAVATYLIYRFYAETTDDVTAVTASSVFLSVFAFGQYLATGNYNFVAPYSHQLTHSMVLSLAALYVMVKYLKAPRGSLLYILGVLAGLVFLAKSEVFIALAASIVTALAADRWMDRTEKRGLFKRPALCAIGFLTPILIFLFILSRHLSMAESVTAITIAYQKMFGSALVSNKFYSRVIGTDVLRSNIAFGAVSLSYLSATLAALALVGIAVDRSRAKWLKTAVTLSAIAGIFSFFFVKQSSLDWLNIPRSLPVVLALFAAILLLRIVMGRASGETRAVIIPTLCITVFSLVLLTKMLFNVHLYHYGFAVSMPSTLVFISVLSYFIPKFVCRSRESAFAVKSVALLIIFIGAASYASLSIYMYGMKNYPIADGPDRIVTYSDRLSTKGSHIRSALDAISSLIKEDETMLVLPEGIMLNYLSRRISPYPYSNVMPFEIATVGEDRILAGLKKADPDYIVLVDRNTSEFGCPDFGKGFAVKIYDWINDAYAPVWMTGNKPFTGKGFGIIITKRRPR